MMAYNYHRRHMKALAEASNSATYSDADSTSNPGNVSTSNHCEEWNPNQIVYNKVCKSFKINCLTKKLI
jgi:hypothetical protein